LPAGPETRMIVVCMITDAGMHCSCMVYQLAP